MKGKPKQESVTITWGRYLTLLTHLCYDTLVDPPDYNGGAIVKFYNVMKKQKGILCILIIYMVQFFISVAIL